MNERIRYAWGDSPYGKVLVAMAGSEVVFFGFPAREDTAIEDLRERYPGAAFEEDAPSLAGMVAELTQFASYFNPKARKG
jgi:O6-methylguanine-DNA--protein-cysteine methyltransferase